MSVAHTTRVSFPVIHAKTALNLIEQAQRSEDELPALRDAPIRDPSPPDEYLVELVKERGLDMEAILEKANEKEHRRQLAKAMDTHRAFTTTAVIMTAAFVEATINDILAAIKDDFQEHFLHVYGQSNWEDLDSQRTTELRTILSDKEVFKGVDRWPTIKKYNWLLTKYDQDPIRKGEETGRSIQLVFEIRNKLIHARPHEEVVFSTIDNLPVRRPQLRERLNPLLAEHNIQHNPFAGARSVWFPDQLFSAGFARWAFEAGRDFTNTFFQRLDVPSPYRGMVRGLMS